MSSPVRRLRILALRALTAAADRYLGGSVTTPGGAPVRQAGVVAPVLVLAPPDGGFARYYPEILGTEGFTSDLAGAGTLTAADLAGRQVVLVGETAVDAGPVGLLTDWVGGGGCLIAMRPDPALAGLLGLRPSGDTVDGGHVEVDTTTTPGAGITGRPLQVHGPVDGWVADGADVVARVGGRAAVTVHRVGDAGGAAVAFAYDLARSVVLTRQGNPAWAGQNRDGDELIRSDDLFFGGAVHDPQPDWVDPDLLDIPQADEQQRLLANLIVTATAPRVPLPRFWYLPHGTRAAVVMTGDDHGVGGTIARFEAYAALDRAGASAADWECIRATSYVFPRTRIPWRTLTRLTRAGFEISLHVDTGNRDWTPDELRRRYDHQLQWFRNRLPFAGPPVTHRTHCVAWSDYASQPRIERERGIRLDTNYYFYPAPWVAGRGGHFTGSALPMRFADVDGEPIDVFQAVTQITDESGQELPRVAEEMLDAAIGPDQHVTVLTVNAHTDYPASGVSDAVVGAAIARDVPIVSARQLLTWLDARNASSVDGVRMVGDVLRFDVRAHADARGLQLLVPFDGPDGTHVETITCDGRPSTFSVETFKGVRCARVTAAPGVHQVRYVAAPASASIEASTATDASRPTRVIAHRGVDAFALGVADGVEVGPAHGGEVVLAPLARPATPDDTVETIGVDGELVFDGGRIERFGVGRPDGDGAWFETGADGHLEVVARTGGVRTAAVVPGTWSGARHRFRLERWTGEWSFWIDGADVAVLPADLPLALPVLVDGNGSAAAGPAVDWVRVLPHTGTGTYTSPVVDGGEDGEWGAVRWTAVFTAATDLTVEVRTGDGDAWSSWVEVPRSGHDLRCADRCLQYRVTLRSQLGLRTPSLRVVELERRG